MKRPFSSSPSSTITTSQTTPSTDANLDTSRKDSPSGCISTLFRRILQRNVLHQSIPTEAFGTPNVVAKLMGLDSIPIVTRSRSMNSAESRKEFEETKGTPRRTKSCREIPCFRELEDDKFYILIFENGNKDKKFLSKGKRSEKGFKETEKFEEGGVKVLEEVKQSNENRGRSRANRENLVAAPNCCQRGGSKILFRDKTNVEDQKGTINCGKHSVLELHEPLSKRKDSTGEQTRVKKRKDDFLDVKTHETYSNSQNSSPHSVLEDIQSPVNGNATNPEVSRLGCPKSRIILWEELENFRRLSNAEKHETLIINDRGSKENNENDDGLSEIVNSENDTYAEILEESYKLAEEEMLKEAWKLEDYEKVGENLEAGILDHMIDQLVGQLTVF